MRGRGAAVHLNTPVVDFDCDGGRARAVVAANGERIPADRIVVAAGAWSTPLLAKLGVRVPMEAGKGYHLDGHPPAGAAPTHAAVCRETPFRLWRTPRC